MNRRRGFAATVVGALSIALAFTLVGGALAAKKKTVRASAVLSGAKEVPAADPDGSGTAEFKLKKKKKKVCYEVSFEGIGAPFVAHIHPGKAGVNGPPLITLFESPTSTFSSPQKACVDAKKKQIKKIAKKPKNYYVNIHNEEFPSGAIRGQLEKGPLAANDTGGGAPPAGGGGGGGALPY